MHREERSLYVGIPAHENTIDVRLAAELVQSTVDMWRYGWTMQVFYVLGDPFIGRARDQIFAAFLRSNCAKLLFIDDDVVPERGAIARIIQHNDPIIGGLYPARSEPEDYKFNMRKGENHLDERTLLRVDDLPGGFLCITREAAEQIRDANLDREYHEGPLDRPPQWSLFDEGFVRVQLEDGTVRGGYRGEDYDFCRRARLLNIPIMADPWIKFDHVGKKAYKGCFGTWKLKEIIKHEESAVEPAAVQMEHALPPTPTGGGDEGMAERPVETMERAAGAKSVLAGKRRELNGGVRPAF